MAFAIGRPFAYPTNCAFSHDGSVLTYWGSLGPAAYRFYNPWSVCITRAGNVRIGETYGFRIEVYRYP